MSCEHHHDHDHRHHEHPHDAAQELAEGALALSAVWERRPLAPVPLPLLEEKIGAGLTAIARRLASDGLFFGHVKALLEVGPWRTGFSVTRLDGVDRTCPTPGDPPGEAASWRLTVNVISLFPAEELTQADLAGYFPL